MPPAPVTLDAATPADIPDLVALLHRLFAIEQDFQANPEKQIQGLTRLMASPAMAHIAVARDGDGRVVAMVSAQLVISTAEGAPSAWIEDMVVAPEWQGQGVGRRVLAAVLAWAKDQGATRAQLLADLDNAPALAYYDHLGWQATRLGARRLML